jgi:AraC-like DNA-binding protein
MGAVGREVVKETGLDLLFLDLAGECISGADALARLDNSRRRRSYAMQESMTMGEPYIYRAATGIVTWVLGLEDRRMILGSMVGVPVLLAAEAESVGHDKIINNLHRHGMDVDDASALLVNMEVRTIEEVGVSARRAQEIFYRMSGWKAEFMQERSLQIRQQKQLTEAIENVRRHGGTALYAFEKERILLSNIRAGDRNASRSILNEMLAAIYMSAPQTVVLRARVIELLSCLVRAAIEDNPLLEPLIERNHIWTENLIRSESFEDISSYLMHALDEFIDDVYLHGVNRSNVHVRNALEFIADNYSSQISLKEVAGYVGLSPWRLAHLVKEYTGRTVLQAVMEMRVRRAQELLMQTTRSCVEIAYEVGFGDQSYFTRNFRKATGMTPLQYRKRH